jgi:hypothetical protein
MYRWENRKGYTLLYKKQASEMQGGILRDRWKCNLNARLLEAKDIQLKLSSVCKPEREKCADKSWSSTQNLVSAVNLHLREQFLYLYDGERARWDDLKVAHNTTTLPNEPQTSDYALGPRQETKLASTTHRRSRTTNIAKTFLAFYITQILTDVLTRVRH